MSVSTGTATTAIAEPSNLKSAGAAPAAAPYIGRFAPSPTGPLHFGSLVAALGSYLDARHHGGRWLVRMEDLDTARVVPGCADNILRTLETFGLYWDGEVLFQSRHTDRYAHALEELRRQGRAFECSCSRKQLQHSEESGYPGTCREKPAAPGPTATRFRIDEHETVQFEDRFQGTCSFEMHSLGDVVIRRRDGVFAYQLAVVVDDAAQDVSSVVRGADLLASTPWQLSLQSALGFASPTYAHLPVITEPSGTKLAKSARSVALDRAHSTRLLLAALHTLNQRTHDAGIEFEAPSSILARAVECWSPRAFHGVRSLPAPQN